MTSPPHPRQIDDTEDLIATLGQAQLASGYPVNEVDETLKAVANAYGRPDLQIYVLPNAVFVDDAQGGRARIVATDMGSYRLDQATVVHRIARQAVSAHITAAEATRRLTAVAQIPARFPTWAGIVANGFAAAGFALVFRISLWGVLISFILGMFVAVALVFTAKRPPLNSLVPFFAAAVAAYVVFTIGSVFDEQIQPIRAVAAPIITLIPGVGLTRGTQELANGQLMSGSARLVNAVVQTFVLAFGVIVGAQLAPIDDYQFGDLTQVLLPWWAAIIGVLVFAVGQSIVSNESRGGIRVVVALALIAYGVQMLMSAMIDPILGAGAAAATALFLAIVYQRRSRRGMPAFALFEPVFWLLVPGSLGLVALTETIAGSSSSWVTIDNGGDVLFATGASILAITIGMVIASALSRFVPAVTPDVGTVD